MTTTTTTPTTSASAAAVTRTEALIAIATARLAVTLDGLNTAGLTCNELHAFVCLLIAAGQDAAAVAMTRTHAAYDCGPEGEASDAHRPPAGQDIDAYASAYVWDLRADLNAHVWDLHAGVLASALAAMAEDLPSRWMTEGNVSEDFTCAQAYALTGLLAVGGHRSVALAVADRHNTCCHEAHTGADAYVMNAGSGVRAAAGR